MNKKPDFDQTLTKFSLEQLKQEILIRQIHASKSVVVDTVRDGNIIFSIDPDDNLLLEIGVKKHRIHPEDIKKLLILFELVQ